jgi:1-acyl-sn-glycerol-3-phosphate acyltransferase
VNQVDQLTAILAREGAEALGWEDGRRGATLVGAALRPAARRIAREFAACDAIFASRDLHEAARRALAQFAASVEVAGADALPRGPVLVVANHPGLTDAVAVIAALGRADARIVAADYPFLHAMRGLAPSLIFLGATGTSQLAWIRAASRQLNQGGVVLLFPAGRLEPDPTVLGARRALLPWSESIGLIRRFAPETQVVPAAVSGVLSARAFAHPLTRIRRASGDRQRVATLLQMLDPWFRRVTVRIAFGAPLPAGGGLPTRTTVTAVLAARVRELLLDPPKDWTTLAPQPFDPATTTAA